MKWERVSGPLESLVFPAQCHGCDINLDPSRQVGFPYLCEACAKKIIPIEGNFCDRCGQSFEGDLPTEFECSNCRGLELHFDFARGACLGTTLSRDLVHGLKYRGSIHLARPLAKLLLQNLSDPRIGPGPWWIVPVPLHRRRLKTRGFNQAEEIARQFTRQAPAECEFKLWSGLRRVRATPRQAQLDRSARLSNLAGAFALRRRRFPSQAWPKEGDSFILVDDVITTGATLSHCAEVLRTAFQPERLIALGALRG
ncbi:MAG: ComF family protein [Verrucomicrobiota bacterium]